MKLDITDHLIRQAAFYDETLNRGKEYFKQGRVTEVKYFENNLYEKSYEIHASVSGSTNWYRIVIGFSPRGYFQTASCTCPAFNKYRGHCKHVIATLLHAKKQQRKLGEFRYENGDAYKERMMTKKLIEEYEQTLAQAPSVNLGLHQPKVKLIPKLKYNGKFFSLEASIGRKRAYIIKDFFHFTQCMKNSTEYNYGKELTLRHELDQFEDDSLPLLQFILDVATDQMTYYTEFSGYVPDKKSMLLTHAQFERFFDLYKGQDIAINIDTHHNNTIYLNPETLAFNFDLQAVKDGYELHHPYQTLNYHQTPNSLFLITEQAISRSTPDFVTNVLPLIQQMITQRKSLHIATELLPGFLGAVLPRIKPYLRDDQLNMLLQNHDITPLQSQIYLDINEDQAVTADIKFAYGDIKFNPYYEPKHLTIIRDKVKEAHMKTTIESYNFKHESGQLQLHGDDDIYHFIKEGISQLINQHEVHVTDRLKNLTQKQPKQVHVGVRLQSDLMTFKLEDLAFNITEYADILAKYKQKKKFHRLKDGTYLDLETEYMDSFFNLVEDLDLDEKDLAAEEIELSKYRALYLDRILHNHGIKSKQNRDFKQLINDFSSLEEVEYELPTTLQATLRPYQEVGFRWLKTLSDYQMGGILADDMGLGKTLQMIALLCSDIEAGCNQPSLIVAPSSLVLNWKAELEKFAPHLNVLAISGTAQARKGQIASVKDYNVVLTSYDLLRRDIEHYDQTFRYTILDEAHYIKNQNTVNAKAVKRIKSEVRYALTGTPLENSIADVWSIFDFILPGYLLTYSKFKKQYETPIAKNQDAKLLTRVHQLVAPFIMRRLKADVLTELPDKIESIVYCEMEGAQKEIYDATLVSINAEIADEVAEHGANQTRMKMLSMLTRLRQLCCHPALYLEDYAHDSAKLSLCMELIQDCMDSGHRILLFSQFTSMFEFLGRELDAQNIPYFTLTGSTKPAERLDLANRFNEGDVPIFLISLKAGGTGLNLTGADVVIHYDPWWNMSAQNQATDRAYRMGQTNKVQVFKLITKNTIEEKIEKLQQRKLELSQSLVQEGEQFITALSASEIQALFAHE